MFYSLCAQTLRPFFQGNGVHSKKEDVSEPGFSPHVCADDKGSSDLLVFECGSDGLTGAAVLSGDGFEAHASPELSSEEFAVAKSGEIIPHGEGLGPLPQTRTNPRRPPPPDLLRHPQRPRIPRHRRPWQPSAFHLRQQDLENEMADRAGLVPSYDQMKQYTKIYETIYHPQLAEHRAALNKEKRRNEEPDLGDHS